MATAERVLWETVTVVVFLIVLVGTVIWSGNRLDRHRARLEAEFEAKIATAEEQQRQAAERLEQDLERRARESEVREAKTTFRSFEAGVRSAVVSRWGNYVSQAKSNLLEEAQVTFVHIITPAGLILASSDEKLTRTGRMDERGDWAMAVSALEVRDGTEEGQIELAGPIGTGSRPAAYLWLGYDLAGSAASPTDN